MLDVGFWIYWGHALTRIPKLGNRTAEAQRHAENFAEKRAHEAHLARISQRQDRIAMQLRNPGLILAPGR
jgi:hypothetical protein